MTIVKIFSDQYNTFLNELVRLFPYKLEMHFLTTYASTFTCEYLLEEGSKHISGYVESAISNRDVEGLVYLVPDNHKSTVRGYVDELTDKNLKTLWAWADLFVKTFKKYKINKDAYR